MPPPDEATRHALLALHLMDQLGPIRINTLLAAFDHDPRAILRACAADLEAVPGIGRQLAQSIERQQAPSQRDAEAELAWLARHQAQLITQLDPDYPERLRHLPDPPVCLFLRGQLPSGPALALVGTRACTPYGSRIAETFARQLAQLGITIVSGLARGIDTHGHLGALAAPGPTIAVVGSGLSLLYPSENEALAERIVASGNALISEFPHRYPPQSSNFPRRNRIVAALADACLVVECGAKGGSLITARLAAELGRPVHVIPGPIDRPASVGCHALIRDGAQLVTSVDDIVSDLGWATQSSQTESATGDHKANHATLPAALARLDPALQTLWQQLHGQDLSLDELIQQSQLPAQQVSTALLQLELLGLIRPTPGARYQRA